MKNLLRLAPVFILFFTFCTAEHPAHEIKVMSFNIRFDNPADGINAWEHRIPLVEKYMNDQMPDIVGMQENLYHQNEDLLRIMPGYAYIGTGRDDGERGGEFSPVFYRTQIFDLMEHGQFWLSETPDTPGSIGWEAVLPRVVSWARLKHLESESEMFVFNTHFSHVSDLAREKSMLFMSNQIRKIAGSYPVIVTGDFNIAKGSPLYHQMIDHLKENNGLRNVEYYSQHPVDNADDTFNAFRDDTEPRVIDYIFTDKHFEVRSYGVDKVKEGEVFISDHWPIKAVLYLK